MIFEESVQIFYRFLEITAFVEDFFRDFDERAFLICYDSRSSGYIIDKRDLAKRITRIIVDILFFPPIFLIFAFDTVDTFEHDEEVFSNISLLKDNLMQCIVLKFKMHGHLLERWSLSIE
jgi:hypothetical protein